jgi:hypothetical protein
MPKHYTIKSIRIQAAIGGDIQYYNLQACQYEGRWIHQLQIVRVSGDFAIGSMGREAE